MIYSSHQKASGKTAGGITMETTQLRAYLEQIVTLETQYQTANQAYQNCANKIASLGKTRVIHEPEEPEEESGGLASGLLMGIVGFAICAVIWMILDGLNSYTGTSWLWGILTLLSLLFQPLSIIAGLGWVGYCLVMGVQAEYAEKYRNKERKIRYERALQEYWFQKSKDGIRVKAELAVIPDLKRNAQMLLERAKKSKEILDRYYSLNIITPKYQSLICAATFLEYLENERCSKLTGHEGCYNLFEAELRQGVIIAQLTNITQQLKQMRANQERAADALEKIQRTCSYLNEGINGMNGKMDIALENQRVHTYYAEQTARDQRLLNDYVIMRDILWARSDHAS